MSRVPKGSAATRLFFALVGAVLALAAGVAVVLFVDARVSELSEAERTTQAVAATLSASPFVGDQLLSNAPSRQLQPYAERVMEGAEVDFVTIMTVDGTRVTHRDPQEIGRPYRGTIPSDQLPATEEYVGTLGPSVRSISPVMQQGEVVGWVAAGVTLQSISSGILPRLPLAVTTVAVLLVAGLAGALFLRRGTRRVTGDLAASEIRDTLSSAESMRTLGEALRAQTHEHGNRVHTAVALLELGRIEEAIELLTASSRSSQALIDQVAAPGGGDPTLGALLLGKASQARERGVELEAQIDPSIDGLGLSAVDAVSVLGNLIDNALEAVALAEQPRWVRVRLGRTGHGEIVLTVSDSGSGVPAELRERVFEPGFTTNPAGVEGRGVGLPLLRDIVEAAGGTVGIDAEDSTCFRVILPGAPDQAAGDSSRQHMQTTGK